MDQAK